VRSLDDNFLQLIQRLYMVKGVNLNSKWHGIEKGRALNEKEIVFVVALIMEWIER
jgi:hypothetical protein